MHVIDNRECGPPDFLIMFTYDSLEPSQTPVDNLSDLEHYMAAAGLTPADCSVDPLTIAHLRLREGPNSLFLPRLGSIPPGEAMVFGEALGWPEPVIHQLLLEHGQRQHIESQYGHLHLPSLIWTLESHSASHLASASHELTKTRVQTVAADPEKFIALYESKGHVIWNGTWQPKPFFIDQSLLQPDLQGLHLMEGHTRLGLLRGLLDAGSVEPDSMHGCWVARQPA